MALKVETENKEQAGPKMIPGQRLWITRDGKRLVAEGDAEAYSLWCTENQRVRSSEFNRLTKASKKKKSSTTKSSDKASSGTKGE